MNKLSKEMYANIVLVLSESIMYYPEIHEAIYFLSRAYIAKTDVDFEQNFRYAVSFTRVSKVIKTILEIELEKNSTVEIEYLYSLLK